MKLETPAHRQGLRLRMSSRPLVTLRALVPRLNSDALRARTPNAENGHYGQCRSENRLRAD